MVDRQTAMDWVCDRQWIRVRSGASGLEHQVQAEGRVYAYSDAPTVHIEHADGQRSSWQITLPIDKIDPPEPPDDAAVRVTLPAGAGTVVYQRDDMFAGGGPARWFAAGQAVPETWSAVCTHGTPELLGADANWPVPQS